MPAKKSIPYAVSTDGMIVSMLIFYDGSDREEYICECQPHNQRKTNKAVWRIKRIKYTATGNIEWVRWANADARMKFIADDHAFYTY